jgi:hypothetical protein
MPARPRQIGDIEQLGEIEELEVHVVRPGELGGKGKHPVASAGAQPAAAQRARSAPAARGPAPPPPRPAPGAEAPPAAVQRPATQAPAAKAAPARKRLLTFDRVFFTVCAVLFFIGFTQPTELYITPKRGIGYALGIIGGSLMLLLLVYSLRKRYSWLAFLGSTPSWFRFHMVLGILGPLCILYHANFGTGATNSNVALFAMLIVAGSGFVGRYFYSHVHYGLYGRKLELGELRAGADKLRSLSSARVSFLPDLMARLENAEQRVLDCGPHLPLLSFAKPLVVGMAAKRARWQLHHYLRGALHASARTSKAVAAEHKRLRIAAGAYIDRRLTASKRVAEFAGYERLFSLWHALHIPLIFMLAIAAVVHVIAVNIY